MPLLDFDFAASHLGIARPKLKRLVASGQIPHVILPDGTVMFEEVDLYAWLRELPRRGTSKPPVETHQVGGPAR